MKFILINLLLLWCLIVQAQVSIATYGGLDDGVKLSGINTTTNSATITCASANFLSSDVGKCFEIPGAGPFSYQGAGSSNFCYYGHIATYISATSVTLDQNCYATMTTGRGWYGTDDYHCLTNAIAHISYPQGSVFFPVSGTGNYLIFQTNVFQYPNYNFNQFLGVQLTGGGCLFYANANAKATLVNIGEYNSNTLNSANGYRGALFSMSATMTNNNPIAFSNLVINIGSFSGNQTNVAYPPAIGNGNGWDGTHHFIVAEPGGTMISTVILANCDIGWSYGEMVADFSSSPYLYFILTNDFFHDGNAQAINDCAHNAMACTFSNINEAEEFYRAHNTNSSFMSGCTIQKMTGNEAVALNGGYPTDAPYVFNNNIITNCNLFVIGQAFNIFCLSNYDDSYYGCAPDSAVGQFGVSWASNWTVAYETAGPHNSSLFTTENSTAMPFYSAFIYSNTYANSYGIALGFGQSSNVWIYDNTGGGWGPNLIHGQAMGGQLYWEQTNNALAYFTVALGGSAGNTVFTASNGCFQLPSGGVSGSQICLDNVTPQNIPTNFVMMIHNTTALTLPVFGNTTATGTSYSLAPSTYGTYWFNALNSQWTNQPPYSSPIITSTIYNPWIW